MCWQMPAAGQAGKTKSAPGGKQLPPATWPSCSRGAPTAAEGPPPACRSRPQAAARLRCCSPQRRPEHPPRCRCCRLAAHLGSWRCPGVCPAALQIPTPAQVQLALQGRDGRVGGGKGDAASQPGAPSPVPLPTAGAQARQASQADKPAPAKNAVEERCRLHPATGGLTLWLRQRRQLEWRGGGGHRQAAARTLAICSRSGARESWQASKCTRITARIGANSPGCLGCLAKQRCLQCDTHPGKHGSPNSRHAVACSGAKRHATAPGGCPAQQVCRRLPRLPQAPAGCAAVHQRRKTLF